MVDVIFPYEMFIYVILLLVSIQDLSSGSLSKSLLLMSRFDNNIYLVFEGFADS